MLSVQVLPEYVKENLTEYDKIYYEITLQVLSGRHIILVCKYRKSFLTGNLDKWIKTELSNIALDSEFDIDAIESDKDHIHILISYEPQVSISMIIRRLKTLTTHRVWKYHETEKEKHFWNERTFWSDGYFACSVGDASTEVIRTYIQNQG